LDEEKEGLEGLFFELASESRMSIMRKLSQESLKMQELGKTLNLTATETFRQLQRLSDKSLISKATDGSYRLTSYGRIALFLLPSLELIIKQKQYFLEHDIWQLPPEFIHRIGELNGATLSSDIPANLNRVEEMIKVADEYLWTLSGQVLAAHSRAMVERCQRGLRFRSIHSIELMQSEIQYPGLEHRIERRYMKKIPGIIVVTEKEAVIALPYLNGKPDYAAFFGKDPDFRKWVCDLYRCYWEKGEAPHKPIYK